MKLDLITDRIERIFPRYLAANIASSILISLNYFVDMVCVGQSVGELGLASLNVAVPATGFLYALGFLFGAGGANRYSGYLGERKTEKAKQVFGTTLLACVATAAVLTVAGLVFLQPIGAFLGAAGDYRQGTLDYLLFAFAFAPGYMLEPFLSVFLANDKAPRLSVLGNGVGVAVNVLLDVLFISVFGWGLGGASLASGAGVLAACVLLMCGAFRKNSGLHLRQCRPNARELVPALKVGVSSCLRELTGSLLIVVINLVLVNLPNAGEKAVAAYGVVASYGTVILCTLAGVSDTIQPLVSINTGAGKSRRSRRILWMGVLWALGIMGVYVFVGELWPETLIRIFVDSKDPEFLAMSIDGIRAVFPCYLAAGVTVCLNVYFEAVQASLEAFWLSMLRGFLIPTLTVFVCVFFLGVKGVWVSFLLSECVCMAIALLLSRRVSERLKAWNLNQLDYYDSDGADDTIDTVFRRIGADELSSFKERILRCRNENPEDIGIPLYVGLEDFSFRDEEPFKTTEEDPGMGLLLAAGAVLYTNLYEQEADAPLNDPPIVRAMHALASHCFLSRRTEEDPDVPPMLIGNAELIRLVEGKGAENLG